MSVERACFSPFQRLFSNVVSIVFFCVCLKSLWMWRKCILLVGGLDSDSCMLLRPLATFEWGGQRKGV